jgi:hypothetical protein
MASSSTSTTSNLPTPQSYEQLLSDMLSSYAASQGISDFNVGGVALSLFEVVALVTARASGDIFQILTANSVMRATGSALQLLATENGVTPLPAQVANGYINVIDTSFTKISTVIYSGTSSPNVGSTTINIASGSTFPPTGAVYLGRGTPDVEGPIAYTSVVQSGTFWVMTLSTPTTKYHNVGETVILSQGGLRTVPLNTIAISPGIGSTANLQYQTTTVANILDGETEVDNVPIAALTPGSANNVPASSINSFASVPFNGATVINPLPLTSGSDGDTDDTLRARVQLALASTGLGTITAIENAIIGATAPDQNDTIQSASVLTSPSTGSATVYIDDGTGYEATVAGVGIEPIVSAAIGGEQFFQLATGGTQAPVAKAFLESTQTSPFDLIGGDTLAITVGETTYQHVFQNSDFLSPGGATAFEVTASVNADTSLGFEAVTSDGGTFVVFRAKVESPDSLQIALPTTSGRNAATLLGLPSNQEQTLRLYKNNIPLSKDGNVAEVFTQSQALWSSSITNGDTLILAVDGTASITYTVLNTDFISTGLYTTVSSNNSLAAWAQVFNNKLTGVTTAVLGNQLTISSNLGPSNRAEIVIDPTSTLVTKGMFSSTLGLSSQGKASDFTLDRNTAQFELVDPLIAGDQLSAGSSQTQAMIKSTAITASTITFPSEGHVWFLIDNPGTLILTGVQPGTLLSVSLPSANIIRYTSSVSGAFGNVLPGDYVIVWSPQLPAVDQFTARVYAVTSTTLDILVTPGEYAAATPASSVPFSDGFVVLRSTLAPQAFEIQAGTYSLNQIVDILQEQTNSLTFSVSQEEFLVAFSNTLYTYGSLMVVTADQYGQLMSFPIGSSSSSQTSLIASYDSQEYEADFPLFLHSTVATGAVANPTDSYLTSFMSSASLSGSDPNQLVSFLHPYGVIRDDQAYGEWAQQRSVMSGTTINITNDPDLLRLRGLDGGVQADRYYLASPLNFGSADTSVIVLDENPVSETFTIPYYRRAQTNQTVSSNPNNFNAYDIDSGATTSFATYFGTFDFSNFKVLMQAKKSLVGQTGNNNTVILYRSTPWGRTGERTFVGYAYPAGPNASLSNLVTVGDTVNVYIVLESGATVVTSIDATTQWNVTVTANTPSAGVDQVTYTWTGTGTTPGLGGVVSGDYINITTQTGFSVANTGVFRVSSVIAPTPNSFTVEMADGLAVPQSNIPTLSASGISFYGPSTATANDVIAYVNTNLSSYITAALATYSISNDGSGTITLSTAENSGFAYQNVGLEDGINWLSYANPSANTVQVIADTQISNNILTDVFPVGGIYPGASISGLGILGGTTVISVSGASVTMSQGASASGTNVGLTFVNTGTPQFVLKNSLALPTDTGYAFNNGEIVRFIPTTVDQVRRLISVLAVSGFTVYGSAVLSDRGNKLNLSTDTLGSSGAIQIIGGSANEYQVPVLFSAIRLDNTYMQITANTVASTPMNSGQWFQLAASQSQTKNTLFGNNTSVSLSGNDPTDGETVVVLSGRTLIQRYFGKPRNNIRSEGDTFRIEKQGNLVCLSWNPNSGSNPTFEAPVNFNDTGGGTLSVALVSGSDDAQYTILTGSANFTAISIGDLLTVTGLSQAGNNGTFLVTGVNGAIVEVLNPDAVIEATDNYVAGVTFTATTGVSEGDTMILSAPFNILNQGQFRVIRQYNNSVWFVNPDVVEEEVQLLYNPVNLGFDATTSFNISAAADTLYLSWNFGVGTEPTLGNAQMGDIINVGAPFAVANQGYWMVLDSGAKLQQITEITTPGGSAFVLSGAGTYFTIYNAGNGHKYYVWFNVNASNTDPAPGGYYAGIEVSILSGNNTTQVAVALAAAINGASADFSASSLVNIVTVTTTGYDNTIDASNNNVPSLVINTPQSGRTTFLEAINPGAVTEGPFAGVVLLDHRPQMQFWEYEATVPGDVFTITSNVLGTTNPGSYSIVQIIDQNTAVITGALTSVANVSLNNNVASVFVEEGTPYTGYKQTYLLGVQPGSTTNTLITFDTNAQYNKINSAASVEMTSLGKLNFSTILQTGLDSYYYNTGLIREANRIIYGDPRDPVTYPGVGAAGADIFVREPLVLRVQVGIDVRLQTGVPFNLVSSQVRSTVSGLINSNPVGQSIAISDIVSAVQAIPGIVSVAISSPNYSVSSDLITVVPSQKTIIIDPSVDISVDLIT